MPKPAVTPADDRHAHECPRCKTRYGCTHTGCLDWDTLVCVPCYQTTAAGALAAEPDAKE